MIDDGLEEDVEVFPSLCWERKLELTDHFNIPTLLLAPASVVHPNTRKVIL